MVKPILIHTNSNNKKAEAAIKLEKPDSLKPHHYNLRNIRIPNVQDEENKQFFFISFAGQQ